MFHVQQDFKCGNKEKNECGMILRKILKVKMGEEFLGSMACLLLWKAQTQKFLKNYFQNAKYCNFSLGWFNKPRIATIRTHDSILPTPTSIGVNN